MELKLDIERFEKLQAVFIEEIIEMIRVKLLEGGLKDRELEELTASLAFGIATIIDDTAGLVSEGTEVRPYLAFQGDNDEVIHCGENSYTYEYVVGILKKLFDG